MVKGKTPKGVKKGGKMADKLAKEKTRKAVEMPEPTLVKIRYGYVVQDYIPPDPPGKLIDLPDEIKDLMKTRGTVYEKYQTVFAREAKADEPPISSPPYVFEQVPKKATDMIVMTNTLDHQFVQAKKKFLANHEECESSTAPDSKKKSVKAPKSKFKTYAPVNQRVVAVTMTPQRLSYLDDKLTDGWDRTVFGFEIRPYDVISTPKFDMSGILTTMRREEFFLAYAAPMDRSQEDVLEKLGKDFEKAKLYCKYRSVFARAAVLGETITTICNDGRPETTNTAKKGDFVVKNKTTAGEEYILTKEKFEVRYLELDEQPNEFPLDYNKEYCPIGQVFAVEMTAARMTAMGWHRDGYFAPAWGGFMICVENDYIVMPPTGPTEVYRIARTEFFDTYELQKKKKI